MGNNWSAWLSVVASIFDKLLLFPALTAAIYAVTMLLALAPPVVDALNDCPRKRSPYNLFARHIAAVFAVNLLRLRGSLLIPTLLTICLAAMIHTLWVLRERAATHSVMLHSADALEMAIRSRALTQPQPDD